MILIVALNPALDVTHHVPGVDWSGVNRADQVEVRPGGKGLNVARTLRALGAGVRVLGLAGGVTGAGVQAALGACGIPGRFIPVAAETRRTFTVVDTSCGGAALFNEAGPRVTPEEYARFRAEYAGALPGATAVVLSGSLPPGLSDSSYADLGRLAADAGVPAVLDTHGEPLRRGAAARPAIVKPNLAELELLAGRSLSAAGVPDTRAVAQAARGLRHTGPQAVVVSLGAAGLWAVTDDGCWQAAPPAAVPGNATGAGDAVAAGLVHGLVAGRPWAERLRHAVALGTACAAAPVAGEFRHEDYARLLEAVTVRRAEVC